jgi:NAD(P)-dependent dehydrogenase (short-subunit alcohol dehydrogenase family)
VRRTALVTGASRGLGFAVAQALGAGGWHVIATARTVGGLEELDDSIRAAGGTATLVPVDLTDGEGIARLGAAIAERWGGLELFVHCAAFGGALSPAAHGEIGDFDRAMAVNGRALLGLAAALEPMLRRARGLAVICDDPASGAFHAAYAASKAAAREIARAWAAESRNLGPEVRLFAPPPMPTALRRRFFPGEDRGRLTPCAAVAEALLRQIAGPKPDGPAG